MEKLGSILLCLLSLVCSGVRGEQATPALHRRGDTAVFSWNLPDIDAAVITVSLQQLPNKPTVPVVYCYIKAGEINKDVLYNKRVEVLKTGLKVGEGGLVTFTLSNVTEDDAGRYVCINGFGDTEILDNCGQMLVVVGKPKDVQVVASSPPVEGHDLTLRCNFTSTTLPPYHNQPPQLEWFDSAGKRLTPGGQEKEEIRGALLIVRSVQRHDLDLKYSCRVSEGKADWSDLWSDRSAAYVLVPEYKPRESDVDMDRHRVVINQGESVQQQCSATCNPECTITWFKQHPLGNYYRLDSKQGLLDLPNARRTSAGNYRCKAENVHGSANQTLSLVVHYSPNIQQLTINGEAEVKANLQEGDNVTLTCEVDSSPAPVVVWYKVVKNMTPSLLLRDDLKDQSPNVTGVQIQRSLYVSSLKMKGVVCSDTGTYQCRVANNLGNGENLQVDLDVVCMTRNTQGENRLKNLYLLPNVREGILLQFEVEAYPPPKIDHIISEDEHGHRQRLDRQMWRATTDNAKSPEPYLTFFELHLQKADRTLYFDHFFYLYIENSQGTKVLAFQLREKGAPKPPWNLTVSWIEDTWVKLQWMPGFHGGKPQSFRVQYHDSEELKGMGWMTVPSQLQATEEETLQKTVVKGLRAGHTYAIRVVAHNDYGNSSASVINVTTMATTAAASTSGGAIAAIVLVIIILLVIVIVVLVFVFIIRPRRKKQESKEDISREPMLTNGERSADEPHAMGLEDDNVKPTKEPATDTANNNADRDASTEPLVTSQTSSDQSPDDRPQNPDGLIYADLDLTKPKDPEAKPVRSDAVNYETIDFTRQAPPPETVPVKIDLESDEEELPSKK